MFKYAGVDLNVVNKFGLHIFDLSYRSDDLSGQEETHLLSMKMSFFVSRVRSRRYRENEVMLRFVTMVKFTSNGVKTLRSTLINTIKESLRMFTFNCF